MNREQRRQMARQKQHPATAARPAAAPPATAAMAEQLFAAGRLPEAEAAYRKALLAEPANAALANSLANLLTSTSRIDEAIPLYRQALALDPEFAEAHANLGTALMRQVDIEASMAEFAKAIALRPDFYGFRQSLGICWLKQAMPVEAAREMEQALAMNPGDSGLHSSLLFTRCYVAGQTRSSQAAAHREWNARHAANLPAFPPGNLDRSPDRPLRLGFVSGDLKFHPVSFFLEPLLAHRDRTQFACYLYANQLTTDAFSARLNAICDGWRTIYHAGDEAVWRQMRADGIDILIDLSGHTGFNRLPLFARRPAPVSMTWLGYPGSTGLPAIDYRISDAIADPPELDPALSSETVIRLEGGFHCFGAPPGHTRPAPPPALARGAVTFGSFNNLAKVSDDTIALWARVLARVEGARMRIKAEALASPPVQARLRERFARCGIAPDRIDIACWTAGLEEHLAGYAQVDIALDTFPYGGTTTTMEALWMGVPVVSRCGETHMARVGASLLTHAGRPQWIAHSDADFVNIAAGLAADAAALAEERQTLRARLEASPLMDGPGFSRRFEAACREAWRAWCGRG